MLRRSFRLLALVLLCVLLVYAPELFSAVSAPYRTQLAERTLLRIALCTQDPEAAASFYHTLNGFREAFPGAHLRVLRVSEAQLSALSEPRPDVYVLSQDVSTDSLELLSFSMGDAGPGAAQNLYPFSCAGGDPLLCGVRTNAYAQEAAVDFVSYLYAQGSPDAEDDG